jgi:Flp pilus assembly protein TadG
MENKQTTRRRGEGGVAFVEASIALPILMSAIMGAICLVYYIHKSTMLQYISTMAVRNGVIEAKLNKIASPNAEISSYFTLHSKNLGATVSNLTICPTAALPACVNSVIAKDRLFMARVEATDDYFGRYLGLKYVIWVLGINANPVGIDSTKF